MVPLSFLCVIGTAAWMVVFPHGNRWASFAMFALGVFIMVLFVRRLRYQIRNAKPELYLRPYI
jgi:membrane protein implicated in regulation of membrane protease activity